MWTNKKSNIDFVQFAKFTIIYKIMSLELEEIGSIQLLECYANIKYLLNR